MSDTKRRTIEIEEYKQILLDILSEVDTFCRTNNIQYFLTYGTLLGAVRHQGFIPWDDDVDICMLREDYDYFIRLFRTMNKTEYLRVQNWETGANYPNAFAKVIDTRTELFQSEKDKFKMGVYIDIFPLDYCPSPYREAVRSHRKLGLLRTMLDVKAIHFRRDRPAVKNVFLLIGKIAVAPFSRRKIAEFLTKRAKKYNDGIATEYVAQKVLSLYGDREVLPADCYKESEPVKFENLYLMAPKEYDKILRSFYGDYMQLPPEEKRVSHHVNLAYWK